MWVPPTEVSQLPPNYQEIYAEKLHGEVEFNSVKTWIEYVNRLVGAFTGIVVFGVFVASFSYRKRDKKLIFLSFLSVILIGANAALGKFVVDLVFKTWCCYGTHVIGNFSSICATLFYCKSVV